MRIQLRGVRTADRLQYNATAGRDRRGAPLVAISDRAAEPLEVAGRENASRREKAQQLEVGNPLDEIVLALVANLISIVAYIARK